MEEKVCKSPLEASIYEASLVLAVLVGWEYASGNLSSNWPSILFIAIILFIFYYILNKYVAKNQQPTTQNSVK